MANLSQIKREQMIAFLEKLKEQHNDDESLIAFNQIEKELTSKKYGLVWEEHEEKVDEQIKTHIPVFSEVQEKTIKNSTSDVCNFLLEGDNLHSLKLLEKTSRGRVDVIYIDPPYNTGNNDFVYQDAYVDANDSYRHSKWLSFMKARLEVARRLLARNGLIFISIDDRELYNLKLLMDELFDERNFVTCFSWMKTATASNLSKTVRNKMEYVLCYKKGELDYVINGGLTDGGDVPLLNTSNKRATVILPKEAIVFKIHDGLYRAGDYDKVTIEQDLVIKDGKATSDLHITGKFKWSQETINQEVASGTYFLVKTEKFSVRFQRPTKSVKTPSNLITKDECSVGTNEEGFSILKDIFGEVTFDYSKPVSLIKYLISMNPNAQLILDFFAGSGTTGQAVLELNKEDGQERRFILCTNNENGICENVTYERLRTVITGEKANGEKYSDGVATNLKYYRTGFVDKASEEISDDLLGHIKEMIELDYGIVIDERRYVLIYDDESMDDFEKKFDSYVNLKAVFISQDVLLSTSQENILKKVDTYIIPDCYFDFELREVGEIW